MKTNSQFAMKGVAAGALLLLLAMPSFAQSRGAWNRNDSGRTAQGQATGRGDYRGPSRDQAGRGETGYRDDQRVMDGQQAISHGRDRGYDRGVVRGVVDRIDARTGTLWVRDQATGRLIAADLPGGNRNSRGSLRGLHRGDYVELTGQWSRGGGFNVARIDNVRNGRY